MFYLLMNKIVLVVHVYNVMSAEACLLLDNIAKYMKESTQARALRITNETARTPSIMVYATFIISLHIKLHFS